MAFYDRQKNIVLCSDGTGNAAGKGNGTNVYRLFEAVDVDGHRHDPSIPPQLAFYDDGVGTEELRLFKLLGGAFGWGLSRNIRELYKLLVRTYAPGDGVYLFGFSRGAFTVRSLGGLICRIGVVDASHDFTEDERREILVDASRMRLLGWLRYRVLRARVDDLTRPELIDAAVMAAFRRYRRLRLRERPLMPAPLRPVLRWLSGKLLRGFDPYPSAAAETDETRPAYYQRGVTIRCIGVWDTVGALGAPFDWLRDLIDYFARVAFHSTGLHPAVRSAYQALAIDDERETFHPVLWAADSAPSTRRIEQVWFAGAHSNVGGGYPKQGMAHVALHWMLRHAEREGLAFYRHEVESAHRAANIHDKLYDPRSGLGAYYRYRPRSLERLTARYEAGTPIRIHASVFERIATGVQDYGPSNLPPAFEVVDDDGTCLHVPWATTVTEYVRTRQAELQALARTTRRYVGWRRAHYFATLWASLLIAFGALNLRLGWSLPDVLEAPLSALGGDSGLGLSALSLGPLDPWVARAVRLTGDTLALALPDGSRDWVAPAFEYFAAHPARFAIVVALLGLLLWARGALRAKTERGHVAFWEGLRTKLQKPTA